MVKHKINTEPSWSGIINAYYDWIQFGKPIQREIAKESINKLVVLGDLVRQTQKEDKILVITKDKTLQFDSIEELREKFVRLI